MRFVRFTQGGVPGLAVRAGALLRGRLASDPDFPGDLPNFLGLGAEGLQGLGASLGRGPAFDPDEVEYAVPLPRPPKIVCVGLNYFDHTAESGYEQPTFPTFFGRFASGLVPHGAAILAPDASDTLDFEGELAIVIGRSGRRIAKSEAMAHVLGYSIFNDGSVREYQFKSPQWMIGKNFDRTGGFGPELVTRDELPERAAGLKIETRLNGAVVQSSNTDLLVFDLPSIIAHLSEAMTLEVGDVIVTGTPSGVGHAREPRLYMRPGDICEVEVEGLGVLRNPIAAEASVTAEQLRRAS
jgi:acylpyruvate hydrolase